MHGLDVMQGVHAILRTGMAKYLDDIHIFALLLAAYCHDIDHDGFTNGYHIAARTPRHTSALRGPITYQGAQGQVTVISPQEFRHVKLSIPIIRRSRIASSLIPSEREQFDEIFQSVIRATDMAFHGRDMARFKGAIDDLTNNGERAVPLPLSEENKRLFSEMVLHFSDLSNPLRPFETAKSWAIDVLQEFAAQGVQEHNLAIPYTNDLVKPGVTLKTSQPGFLKFVVIPVAAQFARLDNHFRPWVASGQANQAKYEGTFGHNRD
jgi:hypothetical protein